MRAPLPLFLTALLVTQGCAPDVAEPVGMIDAAEARWSPTPLGDRDVDLAAGRDVVQRGVEFLSAQDELWFETQAVFEVVQDDGTKLQFDEMHRLALKRPDRMYWKTLADDASTRTAWIGDGQFTMIREPANVWGRVDVPPGLGAAASRVAAEYNVRIPFVDLLTGSLPELWLGDDVESFNYIGEAWIDGQWTDQVALTKPGVELQIWFRIGARPFPVKMVILKAEEDGLPAYTARFRDWRTEVPDERIPTFTPPAGAERLEIVPVAPPGSAEVSDETP
ncbi:MAG: DUF2092 domain-containing protein [Gammaproteobacteria bacterium]|nr:DUF2092 domain-containing protein [Gammaproteobacteria bacterium]